MTPKRDQYGEHDDRTPGDRRTPCMIEPPVPVCAERMDRLREYVDGRFEATAEALTHKTKENDAHFLNLNNSQSRLDKDRVEFLRIREYKINHKNLEEKIEETNKVIDRNSTRLTNIENLFASEKNVDAKIAVLKEYHEKDLIPITKAIDGFQRLVWVGVGIAIAAQVLLHYYFLK